MSGLASVKPWTLDHRPVKFNKLAGGCVAEMLPYINPYYFAVAYFCCAQTINRHQVCAASARPFSIDRQYGLTCYLPISKVHSTCNYQNCLLACIFNWFGWSSSPSFAQALIRTNFTSHTTSSFLPHNSLSLHHLRIQWGHHHSICQLSHLFLGLLLLKSNASNEGNISAVFLGSSHTSSNCSQAHRSTGHCICILIVAISKPCTEAWGLQKPRIRFITT